MLATYFRNNILHLFALPSLIACVFVSNARVAASDLRRLAGRIYPYRARVRCRDCRRRYSGTTSTSQYGSHVYYRDPYDPANFRHTAACPPPSRARAHLRPLAPLAPLVRPHPETFT